MKNGEYLRDHKYVKALSDPAESITVASKFWENGFLTAMDPNDRVAQPNLSVECESAITCGVIFI